MRDDLVSDVMPRGYASKSWVMAGQGLSSLTNFVPGFYAAHLLEVSAFGVFALIQVVYLFGLGISRSLFTEVAMVSVSRLEATVEHKGAADAVAVTCGAVGIVSGLTLGAIGVGPFWAVLLTGVGLGLALLQDALRLLSISTQNGRASALNDGLWLVGVLIAMPVVGAVADPNPWTVAAAWSLTSAFGVAAGAASNGWTPKWRRGVEFLRYKPRLGLAFLTDWGIRQGASQVATYGLGMTGGLTAIAGIRAAQLLLGPLNILFTGLQLALLPTAVARRGQSLGALRSLLRLASVVLGGAALLFGGAVACLPEDWLRHLVGEQAKGLTQFLIPLFVSLAATGFASGSHMGLRVLEKSSELVAARVSTSMITIGCGIVGFLSTSSAVGGLWGLAIGNCVSVLIWHFRLKHSLSDPNSDSYPVNGSVGTRR